MDKVTYRITLDTHKGGVQKTLYGFFAGDVLARRIAISLVGGSTPCKYDEVTAAVMYVTKPNGTTSYNACTVSDNTIFYDVLQADTDTAGIVTMQFKVMSGETVLYAPEFALEVQESKNGDTPATEAPTYTALEEALLKTEMVASNEQERVDAEEKRAEEYEEMRKEMQEIIEEADALLAAGGISEEKAQRLINEATKNKVDKVEGQGLSTNDYSNKEKKQVADNKTDIEDLKNGTTPAGDSLKLNGLTAEEFVSNGSMVVNGYFKSPVNSSGKTSWGGAYGEIIDEWYLSTAKPSAELTDDGLVVSYPDTTAGSVINQILPYDLSFFESETFTLSAKVDGVVYSKTYTMPETLEGVVYDSSNMLVGENISFDFYKSASQTALSVRVVMSAVKTAVIEWVKLEPGSIATPFVPPNKEVEKLKCGVADADTVDGYHASELVKTQTPSRVSYIGFDSDLELYVSIDGTKYSIPFEMLRSEVAKKTDLANYLPLDGSVPMSGVPLFAGGVGGIEGGQIILSKPESDTKFTGHIAQDVYGDSVRFFAEHDGVAKTIVFDFNAMKEGNNAVLHTGNSAPVAIGTTAPTDTTALWVDTANKVVKAYIDGAWTVVGGGLTGVVVDTDPGVGASVSYADGTLLFTKE